VEEYPTLNLIKVVGVNIFKHSMYQVSIITTPIKCSNNFRACLRNAKFEKYLLGDKSSCSVPLPRNSGKSLQQNGQITQVVHMMKLKQLS